jgi:hypothetical protein
MKRNISLTFRECGYLQSTHLLSSYMNPYAFAIPETTTGNNFPKVLAVFLVISLSLSHCSECLQVIQNKAFSRRVLVTQIR